MRQRAHAQTARKRACAHADGDEEEGPWCSWSSSETRRKREENVTHLDRDAS